MKYSTIHSKARLAIFFFLLVSACGPTQTTAVPSATPPEAAASPTIAETATPLPTQPEDTPTPEPSPTVALPVAAGTAYPAPGEAVNAENAGSLRVLSEIGYGSSYLRRNFGLRLSADEQRLIATSMAGIAVFSASDLQLQHFIPTAALSPALSISLLGSVPTFVSDDGTLAVTATEDGKLQIWDLSSGQLRAEYSTTLTDDDGQIQLMAFSKDDSQLAGVTGKGAIVVLQTGDGQVVKILRQYINNTQDPAFLTYNPSGKYLYYIFYDPYGGVQFHSLNAISLDEAEVAYEQTNRFFYRYGTFSPSLSDTGYEYAYFSTLGWQIDVFAFHNFAPRRSIKLPSSTSVIAVSSNGQWIATVDSYSGQIEVREAETNKPPVLTFPGHTNLPWGAAISADGQTVYSIGMDGLLRMWKAGQQEPLHEFTGFYPDINGIHFSKDGASLLLSTQTGSIFQLNAQDGSLERTLADPREPLLSDWKIQRDGSAISYFNADLASIYGPNHRCSSALSADGARLAQMCENSNLPIRLWDTVSGSIAGTFSDPAYTLTQKWGKSLKDGFYNRRMAFSPDGRWLAVTYLTPLQNNAIRIFDVPTGKLVHTVKSDDVVVMAFSPDGNSLVTSSGRLGGKHILQVIDPASGKIVTKLESPQGEDDVENLVFSPDGSRLLTLNDVAPQALDIYDAHTWEHLQNLTLDSDSLSYVFTSMLVSPDGSLAVLGDDLAGNLYFWDLGKNTLLAQPLAIPDLPNVLAMAFSPDGRTLAVVGQDNRIHIMGVLP